MRLHSDLSKKKWLTAMKGKMDSFISFGAERFTGTFLGPFFRVTYHSGHEWNRRITNEKNTAMGYIVETEAGCEVRFIRTKGLLYPSGFLMYWVIITGILCIGGLASGLLEARVFLIAAGMGFLSMAIATPLTAFFEMFTERSEEGCRVLTAALIDPSDPFAYLNHQHKL